MSRVSKSLLLGALLLAAAVPVFGQQGTSQISGRITDEQGAVLPGVAIVVTNEETGVFREVTSSDEGTYFVSQIPPGRYKIVARLTGFRTVERGGLVVQVGTTLTMNLSLPVGGVEENVTVTGQSPLVDTTSARVGGNIGTDELSELPAMNRNYFSVVALLPGVQFAPSNQMGNDTIIAGGQTSQNNTVTVDGGYNADDALGTSAGAQVRTPVEAIQEFQVLTSMYDAEYGRASGAIVNAVTKSGTNQFRGVAFLSNASNALTSKDFLVKQNNLPKPESTKRDWGAVLGGPVVQNKAHFFVSLERQVDNPTRTRVFPSRPSLDFSLAEERSSWNTLFRFDHQISAAHTWAVRYLRESAPQFPIVGDVRSTRESVSDETDVDNLAVGTLTSVFGNAKVNTLRVARTWEHWWHGNLCSRHGEQELEREGEQVNCPPQLAHPNFFVQASTEAQGPWDSNWSLEDNFSWFVPGKMGDHDVKFGGRWSYTELRRVSQINQNGTFVFNTDLPFDAANPRTYPERLQIRMGEFEEFVDNHTFEAFVQDKWKLGNRSTLSVGLRYDLERIPLDETNNPLFPAGDKNYPVDRNNFSPRIGFTHALDDRGKSVIRGGYGMFYNRTILGAIDDTIEQGKFVNSISQVNFPNDTADPGPAAGQFPSNQLLYPVVVNGQLLVNRALLNQLYPPGQLYRNQGAVIFDSPDRKQPVAHQTTIGYARELSSSIAVNADYIHAANRDMFLQRNLNPMVRANTTRTGAITRVDAFGVLGEPYAQQVWVMENTGWSDYNALNLSLEKRYSNNWSGRISYSLSKSYGTAENQNVTNTYQFLTDLNLDEFEGPSSVDRRHILSINGRTEIPKTGGVTLSSTMRYMSGAPFTIINTAIDANRNGELTDPSPAGVYSGTAQNAMTNVENQGGRNGARGPDYFQLDLRAGWRGHLGGERSIELFFDMFNITNRVNWDNPGTANSDERLTTAFLRLTTLRGGSGFPRQAVFGARYAF
jgi:hypothetical protein